MVYLYIVYIISVECGLNNNFFFYDGWKELIFHIALSVVT